MASYFESPKQKKKKEMPVDIKRFKITCGCFVVNNALSTPLLFDVRFIEKGLF